MKSFIAIIVTFGAFQLSASTSVGASMSSSSNDVGVLKLCSGQGELEFSAPGEGEEVSWIQILSVSPQKMSENSQHSKMVYVPAATLEKEDRAIHVEGFYIDPDEVTNSEYELFIRATGRQLPASWPNGRIPAGQENEPVVGVTCDDAESYARWAGKRLPTEAEREAAAFPGKNEPAGFRCVSDRQIR